MTLKGGTVRDRAILAIQLSVAWRSGCVSDRRVSCEDARRPGVGGMKPSALGHKDQGGAIQYTPMGSSPADLAARAMETTRQIPAATHACRAGDHVRDVEGRTGNGV